MLPENRYYQHRYNGSGFFASTLPDICNIALTTALTFLHESIRMDQINPYNPVNIFNI